MASHPRTPRPGGDRRGRMLRPDILEFEPRVVLAVTFPGLAGLAFDTSGDLFVSYNSTTRSSGQQQSVAEIDSAGYLTSDSVFTTTGASAVPGVLAAVGASASLPTIAGSGDILELQPDGQLYAFNPVSGTSSQYDNLANDTPSASNVYDVQTGASTDLSGQIILTGATFGDFGIYQNSLVVSAEANDWDFVMRVTYGSSGGAATVLVASPASGGSSAAPGGVAVNSQGTVLTTMPYTPAGSTTAVDVPVGFSLFYDTGSSPAPYLPTLGLTSVPDIDSGGITVDSQNNFILAATSSSFYSGGAGVVHINSSLNAFLADPVTTEPNEPPVPIPSVIAYQDVAGTNELAIADGAEGTLTESGELSLFSGQVSPAQLRSAYGIDQIQVHGPGGHHRHRRRLRSDDRHRRGRGRPDPGRRPDHVRPALRHPGAAQLPGRGPERGHHAG